MTPLDELTAQIAMGWGNTPGEQIPSDWRTRQGPDHETRRNRQFTRDEIKIRERDSKRRSDAKTRGLRRRPHRRLRRSGVNT